MFGNMDLSQLGDMMGDLQKKAEEIKKETEEKTFEAKSGGGLINIKANGKGEVFDLNIDDSLLEDKESLQILLISAINDVAKSIEQNKQSMAMNAMGDFGSMFQK